MADQHPSSTKRLSTGNPYHHALRTSLLSLPQDLLISLNLSIETLLTTIPRTYSIYEPLLLLPPHTFTSPSWTTLLQVMDTSTTETFFARIAIHMKITHIALNAPIAPLSRQGGRENVQRRPGISPLYGEFGSFVTSEPTARDFENAFWVSTRQNGIVQVWAPLYTMFSRGNITEKARLLTLPSITRCEGYTAVDLYAGIGYFAFSYVKAGGGLVVGFEINPWSVEGMRRGAEKNGWGVRVVTGCGEVAEVTDALEGSTNTKLVVVQMSNEVAPVLVEKLREHAPPVRHVNLGLLPTSRGAWRTAVQCLSPEEGGWLHVHENFAVKEINEKAAEATEEILRMARDLHGQNWRTQLEHIEKVKTYAPGVMHCVLDIRVSPCKSEQ